jgi:hypothetical protein
VLTQVVLPLERLPADLAGVSELRTLVSAFVDHEVVALGEAALAVLADEFALGPHLPPEVPRPVLVLDLHYREHVGGDLRPNRAPLRKASLLRESGVLSGQRAATQ